MLNARRLSFLFAAVMIASLASDWVRAQSNKSRPPSPATIADFDSQPIGPIGGGFVDSWRWTKEFREQAKRLSRVEIVDTPGESGGSLRIRVDDERIVADEPIPLHRIAVYLQPYTLLHARVQVVSGEVGIFVGGPTAYYANSDVFTEPQKLRAKSPPEWVGVEFNLNHPTWRNYRRAGFSTEAPRNYYLRWAQEPLGIYLAAGSKGEILIDQIDAHTRHEGRNFHKDEYPPEVRPLQSIASFEPDDPASDSKPSADLERTFNLYMAADETEWFDESWKRTKPLRFAPLKLKVVDGGLTGKRSLACTGRAAEEVQCVGVRTTGNSDADAIYFGIRASARSDRSMLHGSGPALPIDFLVFTAPQGKPFDWSRFEPSAELRGHSGPGFDYQFSHRFLRDVKDADFAIYQIRRFVKPDVWSKVLLLQADFTCVYGHGAYRSKLRQQTPLTFDDVVAVAWLRPWTRVGRSEADDTTTIDEISFVETTWRDIPDFRYWWQVPDLKQLIYRDGTYNGRKTLHTSLREDFDSPDTIPLPGSR